MKEKTVLVISDKHCGHLAGLTPPDWQLRSVVTHGKRNKWVKIQTALWREFTNLIKTFGHIDILLDNGDSIDGRSEKTGGVECITTSRDEQVEMAVECIEKIHADKIIMTYGTSYHQASNGEDWELMVAEAVNAEKIGSHEWFSVNGCVFDAKHHIAFSGVPHTMATATLRDTIWNRLWALRGEQPMADVIIRSHVHVFMAAQTGDFVSMTTPALQGMGSRFGSRICSRVVDWGMVLFKVRSKKDFDFNPFLVRIPEQKAKIISL